MLYLTLNVTHLLLVTKLTKCRSSSDPHTGISKIKMAAEFKDNLWYLEIFHDTHMVTATLNRRIILCLNLICYMKVYENPRNEKPSI